MQWYPRRERTNWAFTRKSIRPVAVSSFAHQYKIFFSAFISLNTDGELLQKINNHPLIRVHSYELDNKWKLLLIDFLISSVCLQIPQFNTPCKWRWDGGNVLYGDNKYSPAEPATLSLKLHEVSRIPHLAKDKWQLVRALQLTTCERIERRRPLTSDFLQKGMMDWSNMVYKSWWLLEKGEWKSDEWKSDKIQKDEAVSGLTKHRVPVSLNLLCPLLSCENVDSVCTMCNQGLIK